MEDVCKWNGDTSAGGCIEEELSVAVFSDLCFFDRCPSSPFSRFRFFSLSIDLCFFSDLLLCFLGEAPAIVDCEGISIDILWILTIKAIDFFS